MLGRRHLSARATLLLLLFAQFFAVPLHVAAAPLAPADHAEASSDCPMTERSANESDPTESCECPGGSCCISRTDQPNPVLGAGDIAAIAARPAAGFSIANRSSEFRQTFSTSRSRAPPAPRLA